MLLAELALYNQSQRFELLAVLYAKTQSGSVPIWDLSQVANEKGINKHQFDRAFEYLLQEGLVNSPIEGYFTKITHLGIKAIEDVFKEVNKPSQHFPAYTRMIK